MGRIAMVALVALAAACGGEAALQAESSIIGRVEVADSVAASDGVVGLIGTPLGSRIAADGSFQISQVPPGSWTLEVRPAGDYAAYPTLTRPLGVNAGEVRDVGVLTLFAPGFVSGRVLMVTSAPQDALIGVTAQGTVTRAHVDGSYLLGAIAPGEQTLVAVHGGSSVTRRGIAVAPSAVTRNIDFNFAFAEVEPAEIFGTAMFMDGTSSGITVRLLRAADGVEVDRLTVDGKGAFRFFAPPNAYVVRAEKAATSNQISIPSGVLAAGAAFRVDLRLSAGDADGDGIPDDQDPDIDNDGVENAADSFPFDPRESSDADGDGIGDSSDPDTRSDSDGDGRADDSDNCVVLANPGQADGDGDGVGDDCDVCPGVPNPDQETTACLSTCQNDGDCEADLFCNTVAGTCVECLNAGHCDDALFCNGAESCDEFSQCQPGAPPALSDGLFCTNDSCDENSDSVLHIPVAVDDGLFCTNDSCDENSDAVLHTAVDVDDGVACTVDSCDENLDAIIHDPNHASCPSGACGGGFCNVASGCTGGGNALVYYDSPGLSYVPGALAAQGIATQLVDTELDFVAAFDGGGFDLLVVNAELALPAQVKSRVTSWVAGSNRAILSLAELASDSSFSSSLEVSANTFPQISVALIPQPGVALFSTPRAVPTIDVLVGEATVLTSTGDGFIGVLYDTPLQNAATIIHGDQRVLINGFAFLESYLQQADNNNDTISDAQALLENQIAYICEPPPPPGAPSLSRVAAGLYHTCALTDAGNVRCWGSNAQHQLGNGTISQPIGDNEEPSTLDDVMLDGTYVQVVSGSFHSCALRDDGGVYCWGDNTEGQVGYPNEPFVADPQVYGDVDVGGPVIQLAAGDLHTCALLATGEVRCWGNNDFGGLGYGNTDKIGDDEQPSSVPVVPIGGDVTQIAAGGSHTCALYSGAMRCWGANASGQLGLGNTSPIGDNEAVTTVGAINFNAERPVSQIAVGRDHSCALFDDGAITCFGYNEYGQLGQGSVAALGDNEPLTSVPDVALGAGAVWVAAGGNNTCALLTNGDLRCWGDNVMGQVGLADPLLPALGDDESVLMFGPTPVGAPVLELDIGSAHLCARLSNQRLRCWGDGSNGKLGYGNTSIVGDNETPAAVGDVPWLPVSLLGPALPTLSVSSRGSCATISAGRLRCWGERQVDSFNLTNVGDNEFPYQYGDVAFVSVNVPIESVSMGPYHQCALYESGGVRCWGFSFYGALGYYATDPIGDSLFPAVGPITIGGTVAQVSAGFDHTCVVMESNHAVRCFGRALDGRLGYANGADIGDDEDPASAGDVALGRAARQVVAGGSHSCALLDNGDVRCWGDGQVGQTGQASTLDVGDDETPAARPPVALSGDAVMLAAGSSHTCAILVGGAVQCWGSNSHGQLGYPGLGDVGDNETPASVGVVAVGGAAVAIAAGTTHTCAVLSTGGVRCWGENFNGKLGYPGIGYVGDDETPASVGNVDVGGSAVSVAVSETHTCVRLTGGEVRCWGEGDLGRLGYGNQSDIGDDEPPSTAGNVPYAGP